MDQPNPPAQTDQVDALCAAFAKGAIAIDNFPVGEGPLAVLRSSVRGVASHWPSPLAAPGYKVSGFLLDPGLMGPAAYAQARASFPDAREASIQDEFGQPSPALLAATSENREPPTPQAIAAHKMGTLSILMLSAGKAGTLAAGVEGAFAAAAGLATGASLLASPALLAGLATAASVGLAGFAGMIVADARQRRHDSLDPRRTAPPFLAPLMATFRSDALAAASRLQPGPSAGPGPSSKLLARRDAISLARSGVAWSCVPLPGKPPAP